MPFHGAEVPVIQSPRLLGRHSGANGLLGFDLEVKSQFGIELAVHARVVAQRPRLLFHAFGEHGDALPLLFDRQNARHRAGHAFPLGRFFTQLLEAGPGQLVELRLTVVF